MFFLKITSTIPSAGDDVEEMKISDITGANKK